jgi:two-component system sensor histidine kinase SenX3
MVDIPVVIAGSLALVAVLVAIVTVWQMRRLGRAADDALHRIRGSTAERWWRRPKALDATTERLERFATESDDERARLAAGLEQAPIGILLTGDDGVVTYANETALHMGAKHGEPVAEVRMRRAIDQAILQRRAASSEVELHTPTRRVLAISAVPLDHGVRSLGAVAYIRDITEERRVDAMRRDFIANVGHELKTPLGTMAVLGETIASQRDDPVVLGRLADRLGSEARKLSTLIAEILDLSQVESLDRPFKPVDLTEVISDVVGDAAARAEQTDVSLRLAPLPDVATIKGDRRQLQTMLTNLIGNAIQHGKSAEGDHVVWVRTRPGTEDLTIEIQDHGPGIPEAHLDRVFERFYRVDQTRGSGSGNAGMGLSIARHIARNHGGDITVESPTGEGATFTVRLPVWSEE